MKKYIICIALYILITGCSVKHENNADSDKIESLNRFTSKFNAVISKGFINPITKTYETIIPLFMQTIINNLLEHLSLPYNALCSLLAGDKENTAKCVGSFFINTIFSLGILDIAKMSPKKTSLDDTFKTWEIGQGNYFVIPILGPSTIRGAFAELISLFINPIYLSTNKINNRDRIWIIHTVLNGINSNLKFYKLNNNLLDNSFDYYTALKSFYLQNLQKELRSKDDDIFDEYE